MKRVNYIDRRNLCVADYTSDIARYDLITPSEECLLAARIQQGDEQAFNQLVVSNLRLVVTIAKEYMHLGVAFEDLVEEGNVGLMKAARHFDPANGAKFSTYASLWIHAEIKESINAYGESVRIPRDANLLFARIERTKHMLEQRLERDATIDEIADEMNVESDELLKYMDAMRFSQSLDAPMGRDEEDDYTPLSYLHSDDYASDAQVDRESLCEALDAAMASCLNERAVRIVKACYGFDGKEEQTLTRVAAVEGVSVERIRQIKQAAEQTLSHLPIMQQLRMCC